MKKIRGAPTNQFINIPREKYTYHQSLSNNKNTHYSFPSYYPPPTKTMRSTLTPPPPSPISHRFRLFPSFPNPIPTRIDVRPRASMLHDTVPSPSSFYDLLGISESGTLLEIKQAYKQMARKYHPDVSPPDRLEEYTQRFIRVQEAYETLSDPRHREVYDHHIANGLHLTFSTRKSNRFDEVS